jgi:hypothetical protein
LDPSYAAAPGEPEPAVAAAAGAAAAGAGAALVLAPVNAPPRVTPGEPAGAAAAAPPLELLLLPAGLYMLLRCVNVFSLRAVLSCGQMGGDGEGTGEVGGWQWEGE